MTSIILFVLTATGMTWSLETNMSSMRAGRVKLLNDLRAHSAFKDKVVPAGDDDVVSIHFSYRHFEVIKVDEVDMSVTSVGYIDISWTDPDLTWNKTDYSGVDVISVPFDELWHPTILVTNAADPDYLMADRVETATLSSTGAVKYVSPAYLKTTCDMHLTNYPFDSQICDIYFMPFVRDVKCSVSASTSGGTHDHYTVTGQWTVRSKNITVDVVSQQGDVQIVKFTMTIKRRAMFYVFCVLAPMILTSSMTPMVFWIPPNSGEKISFLVTVFVSVALFLNFIADAVPRNMSTMPKLTYFLVLVNIQCVFAMMATIYVIRKYRREREYAILEDRNGILQHKDNEELSHTPENAKEGEPETETTNSSDSTKCGRSNILKKFSFKGSMIFRNNVLKKSRERQKKTPGCSLLSSTMDAIFFWIFLAISIPCYIILILM